WEPRRRLPGRTPEHCDASVGERPGLPLRVQGQLGDRRLPGVHRQRGHGESPPGVARARRGYLPGFDVGEAGLSGAARPRPPATLGADKGFFHEDFIAAVLERGIEPHIAVEPRGRTVAHARVRMRTRGAPYQLSQRCRKLIEELFGEAKDWHGLRRFRRRGRGRVQQETYLIGWVLNLKRLAKHWAPGLQPI